MVRYFQNYLLKIVKTKADRGKAWGGYQQYYPMLYPPPPPPRQYYPVYPQRQPQYYVPEVGAELARNSLLKFPDVIYVDEKGKTNLLPLSTNPSARSVQPPEAPQRVRQAGVLLQLPALSGRWRRVREGGGSLSVLPERRAPAAG